MTLPFRIREAGQLCRTALSTALLSFLLLPVVQAQVPLHRLRYQPPVPSVEAAKRLEEDRPRRTDMVMVKFRPSVKPTPLQFAAKFSKEETNLHAQNALRSMKSGAKTVPNALAYLRSSHAIGWHTYRLPAEDAVPETLEALRRRPEVLQATMVQRLRLLQTPPNNAQWNQIPEEYIFSAFLMGPYGGFSGLLEGQPRDYDSAAWHYNWVHDTIKALQAWHVTPNGYAYGAYPKPEERRLMSRANLPIVAVLDTGIDMNHPAFGYYGAASTDVSQGGHILKKMARSFYSGNRDPDPTKAMDVFGHGTSVSGVISAAPDNGLGIPGVGFTSVILPVRVYGAQGDGTDNDLYDAIIYAVDSGALIINISARTDIGYSPAAQDVVDYAWAKGSLIVAAIGNDGKNTNDEPSFRRYPASLNKVLAVGATVYGGAALDGGYVSPTDGFWTPYTGTYYDAEPLTSYSDFGQNVGVVAPAGDSTIYENFAPYSTEETWTNIMLYLALNLGFPPDGVPQFQFVYTTSPTYAVPMNDATDTAFGSYAQLGFYGLNYGTLPGTSFASPVVAGLAALYAAKHGVVQQPGAPQTLLAAIQRGSDNLQEHPNGGYGDGGLNAYKFGYGRINAEATLLNRNQRNTTLGGLVGIVKIGAQVQNNIEVRATRQGSSLIYRATTTADGVFHLINLPEANYTVTARTSNGSFSKQNIHVTAGCDTHGIDFALNPLVDVRVSPHNPLIPYGTTAQLSAFVFNTTNQNVTWELLDAPGATLSANGLLTAPNDPQGDYSLATVRATSVQDNGAFFDTPITFVPRLTGLTITPGAVSNGATATGRITLSHPAPTGGSLITILSDDRAATVPLVVTVPAGATQATFSITTSATRSATATVSACYAGITQSAILNVNRQIATISGAVTLEGVVSTAQPQSVTLQFRAPGTTAPLFSQTVSVVQTSGAFTLTNIPRGNYDVAFKGEKWLRTVVQVNNTNGNVSGVTATLRPGDVNDDNFVDLFDLVALFDAYGLSSGDAGWDSGADLNCDTTVDLLDLVLLFNHYGDEGDL